MSLSLAVSFCRKRWIGRSYFGFPDGSPGSAAGTQHCIQPHLGFLTAGAFSGVTPSPPRMETSEVNESQPGYEIAIPPRLDTSGREQQSWTGDHEQPSDNDGKDNAVWGMPSSTAGSHEYGKLHDVYLVPKPETPFAIVSSCSEAPPLGG